MRARLMVVASVMAFAPSAAALAAPTWTGPYLGLTGALDLSVATPDSQTASASYFDTESALDIDNAGRHALRRKEFGGGLDIGYNQTFGLAIVGIEADLQSVTSHRARAVTAPYTSLSSPFAGARFTLSGDTHQERLSTIRLRAGAEAAGTSFIYATAGVAFGKFSYTEGFSDIANPIPFSQATVNKAATGLAFGFGDEFRIGRRFTSTIEFMTAGLGSAQVTVPVGGGGDAITTKVRVRDNLFRVGLKYRLF